MFVSLVMLAALAAPENPPTEVRLPRKPYAFVTFGEGVLERASLVVEATAKSVLRGGHGVVVARFDVSSVMLGDDSVRTVTVLAPPDEFRAGVQVPALPGVVPAGRPLHGGPQDRRGRP